MHNFKEERFTFAHSFREFHPGFKAEVSWKRAWQRKAAHPHRVYLGSREPGKESPLPLWPGALLSFPATMNEASSATIFLLWSWMTMDWIFWSCEPNQTSAPLSCRCWISGLSDRKVDLYTAITKYHTEWLINNRNLSGGGWSIHSQKTSRFHVWWWASSS